MLVRLSYMIIDMICCILKFVKILALVQRLLETAPKIAEGVDKGYIIVV